MIGLMTDCEGFAIGGRARHYQRQRDKSLDTLREQLKAEGIEARKQGKLIWQRGMEFIRKINDEIAPARAVEVAKLTTPAPRLRIEDWGATLNETSEQVMARRSQTNQIVK